MANADDVMAKLLQLEAQIDELKSRIVIDGNQVRVMEGLSDIDESLGTMVAGEFRAGKGTPGHGFSGTRIVYPAVEYDGKRWTTVGIDNDRLMWGASATDGRFYAGGGTVQIDEYGIQIKTNIGADTDLENPEAGLSEQFPLRVTFPGSKKQLSMRITPSTGDSDQFWWEPYGRAWVSWNPIGDSDNQYPQSYIYLTDWIIDGATYESKKRVEAFMAASMDSDHPKSYIKVQQDTVSTDASEDNSVFEFNSGSTATPGHVAFYLCDGHQSYELYESDTVDATEEGYLRIKIGNNYSYIRTYATK